MHKYGKFVGPFVMTLAAIGFIANINDVVRYVRISTIVANLNRRKHLFYWALTAASRIFSVSA